MAPRGAAKARDYDYSNIGKAGRRTGITLKEGRLDEHGMEEIDGMFSSPEKSPEKENGFVNSTLGSDGMSMDEGNELGPADFLNGANGRGSYFPPPVARSPMKTGLTGSPRRTPGLRSSASPQRDIPSSSPSDGKGLGSAKGESRQEVSPLTNRSINAPSLNHVNGMRSNKAKGKKPESAVTVDFSDSDGGSQLNGDENGDSFDQIRDEFADSFNVGDDTITEEQPEEPEQNGIDVDSPSVMDADSRRTEKRKAASKPKRNTQADNSRARSTAQQNDVDEQGPSTQKRKRAGRPPKSQRKTNEDTVEQGPSKRPRTSGQQNREFNGSGNPELDKVVENYVNRTGPLKGRSLYILKREVPTDNSATHTRSGRVSVRPLAYWKNERCIYGDGEAAEGQRYPLSTIKEIIRTEELEPEKKTKGKGKGRSSKKGKSRKSRDQASEDEEEEGYVEEWEKEPGVLYGYVRQWDAETQTGTAEQEGLVDIAYAPSGIVTREVKDSTFKFAKLLSSSFIGSGIVELPPGGVKKPKNSKRMHMVFYVCHGRVQVDISGVQFSAGKGCVFQVPRGNYYSFANTLENDARLFFTQGCIPADSDVSDSPPASKPAATESESTTGRAPTVGKGRPKGKQKAGSSSRGA